MGLFKNNKAMVDALRCRISAMQTDLDRAKSMHSSAAREAEDLRQWVLLANRSPKELRDLLRSIADEMGVKTFDGEADAHLAARIIDRYQWCAVKKWEKS